jgi:hypothetical protein
MRKNNKTIFRIIAKSLGEKSGKTDQEADRVAIVRLIMFLSILITNSFIVANALRHWNDVPQNHIQKVECVNLK